MSNSVTSPRITVGRTGIAIGVLLGLNVAAFAASADEPETTPSRVEGEHLYVQANDDLDKIQPSLTPESGLTLKKEPATVTTTPSLAVRQTPATPSFEELDTAASSLNDALSGARAKLEELRQATELAAMAAELRDELESSIQENNRLAAALAEVQSERGDLEAQYNEARRQIVELTQTVEASKLEIDQKNEVLERQQDEIKTVEQARERAAQQVRELESELADSGSTIDSLRADVGELTDQLEATRAELSDVNGSVVEARKARDDADRELAKVRKQIAGMLRSVLLGGEPIDVSALEAQDAQSDKTTMSTDLGIAVPYEALRASNIRAAPTPDSKRVGYAKQGDRITVIGKVNDRNWYEIETETGIRGFIFGGLIRPAA